MDIPLDEMETLKHEVQRKAKRSRRREMESRLEPGHLRFWYAKQDYADVFLYGVSGLGLYKQVIRSMRHSCHSMCCVSETAIKHERKRRERYRSRLELRRLRECIRRSL